MKLAEFIRPLDSQQREAFARACGTTPGHLRNVAFSGKACGYELAVNVERESAGVVRRWELRERDWHRIWPELVGTRGAPEPSDPGPASQAGELDEAEV